MEKEYASELEYLRFFYDESDFGPAHEDVIHCINEQFEENVGRKVPKEYE